MHSECVQRYLNPCGRVESQGCMYLWHGPCLADWLPSSTPRSSAPEGWSGCLSGPCRGTQYISHAYYMPWVTSYCAIPNPMNHKCSKSTSTTSNGGGWSYWMFWSTLPKQARETLANSWCNHRAAVWASMGQDNSPWLDKPKPSHSSMSLRYELAPLAEWELSNPTIRVLAKHSMTVYTLTRCYHHSTVNTFTCLLLILGDRGKKTGQTDEADKSICI